MIPSAPVGGCPPTPPVQILHISAVQLATTAPWRLRAKPDEVPAPLRILRGAGGGDAFSGQAAIPVRSPHEEEGGPSSVLHTPRGVQGFHTEACVTWKRARRTHPSSLSAKEGRSAAAKFRSHGAVFSRFYIVTRDNTQYNFSRFYTQYSDWEYIYIVTRDNTVFSSF